MINVHSLTDTYELANGTHIPCIGFGTWQSADGGECYDAVLAALRAGYRHIDTAAAYGNEKSVGRAVNDFLSATGLPRSKLFITSKLWNENHGYEKTCDAIEQSLADLKLDYMDLYLIHWPNPLKFRDCWQEANAGSWKAMEEAYKEKKLRAIGISNFCERHIDALNKTAEIKPMVNQIKVCPGQSEKDLISYCRKNGMLIEGYSPLGTGAIFNNIEMQTLSKKYSRSIAQICIRWSMQQGVIPLPKSVTASRIEENSRVFDFEIDDGDCKKIAELSDSGIKLARNPDEAPF